MIWLLRRQTKAHARTRVHNILGVSYFSVAYCYVKAKNTLIKIKNYERTTFKILLVDVNEGFYNRQDDVRILRGV